VSKRILITAFTFPPQRNGVSHVVEAHATGLAHLGHDVTVATAFDAAREATTWNGVKVRQFATKGDGRWIRGGYSGDIRGYQDFIASFNGDLIICHCWQIWSTDLALEVFDHVRCPKLLVSHGFSANILRMSPKGLFRWLTWKPYMAKVAKMLHDFDHVVVLADRKDSKSFQGFFDHKLMHRIGYLQHSVIPNGVRKELFATPQRRAGEFRARHAISERPMLLYVSNYGDGKNQAMAVKAFLNAALPEAVLVLIGSEINDYARGVQSLARQAGPAGQRVVFLEKQTTEEIAAAYCAADLFLCSSKLELQPLVILETMAAGTPFVCTDVGCVRDFPGDEPRRRQLCRQGQAAVDERFTWEKVVQQYDALIEKLCHDRKSGK
jgi:glycosyltransferase involved in cell wall biosynthesis